MVNNKVCAIILAGGQGTRFGKRKQFLIFHGRELWQHLYETVSQSLPQTHIVVVGVQIEGGETRPESVKKGLEWIMENHKNCERVVIMEAARPLVRKSQLDEIIKSSSSSICFVNPVVDTVILKDKTYLIRSQCLHLVSPQAFDFSLLYKAYISTDLSEMRTDETKLMNDTYGIKPDFLEGDQNLYKVTYPKDIAVLEELYKVEASLP